MDIRKIRVCNRRFKLISDYIYTKRAFDIENGDSSSVDRFIDMYNRAIYSFILIATVIVLGFLLFGHGILLKDCFYW